ncbi:MAG: hypothetical protein HY756_11725 [Nitrospirae bacterium]|nr:hypothetical protein [Nitrospirota bacterium]
MKLQQDEERRLCPFILSPAENCYCIKLSSQDVERTVFYCSKNFESCEIYKGIFHWTKKKEASKAAVQAL